MNEQSILTKRCAIYTRKSSEDGLEKEFNSLEAQFDSCSSYIQSQSTLGWQLIDRHYDDGGYSGGNTHRPALQQLLRDIGDGQKVQLVAAEVRRQAEDAAKRARDDEEKRKGRRDRLRELYRKHIPEEGLAVDFDEVRNLVEGIASTTYGAWRWLAELDHIAMADSAEREDFDQLEFLVNRALCELNGVKNIVTLARRLS